MMVQLQQQPPPHEEGGVSSTNNRPRQHEPEEGQPPMKKRKCFWTVSPPQQQQQLEQHHPQTKQRKHHQQQVVQRVRFHSQIQVRYFSAREESYDQDSKDTENDNDDKSDNSVSYSRQELSRFRGSAYAVARAMSRADKDKSLIGSYREGVCQLHQVCAASSCCGSHATTTCKDESSCGEQDAMTTSDKDATYSDGKNVLHNNSNNNPSCSSSGSLSLADQLVDKLKDVLQRLDQQHLHCNQMHSSSILFLGLERHAARDLHQARSVQREEMLQEIRLLQQQQCSKTTSTTTPGETFGLAEAIRVKCEAISRPSRLYALRMARLYT